MLTADDLLAGRVLTFTRAGAYLADLTAATDTLTASLKSHLTEHDDNLDTVLDQLADGARDQWLGRGRMALDRYEWHRRAAAGRARSLERRARAAAEAAAALADLLEHAEHYDTPEDIIWVIDGIANRGPAGYDTPADLRDALVDAWRRIGASKLIEHDAAEALRRHYDDRLHTMAFADVRAEVDQWRTTYLARSVWNADTYMYAIATARDWDELADLWDTLGTIEYDENGKPMGRLFNATEGVRARTAIAAKVTDAGDSNIDIPERLREAVRQFNESTTTLVMRMRAAATMADLLVVSDVITGLARDAEGTLNVVRVHNSKFEWLTAHNVSDADPEGDDWAPAAVLAKRVTAWRDQVYTEATSCVFGTNARSYTEAQRYTLMYTAISEAADLEDPFGRERVKALMAPVERVAEAEADHILTPEHIENLRIIAAPKGERIDTNGATGQ